MSRTAYAQTMVSNFKRRQAIEQLFEDMLRQSKQDAAVTLIKLQGKLRQPNARNVG